VKILIGIVIGVMLILAAIGWFIVPVAVGQVHKLPF
jgi:hypothetical protein